MPIERARRRPPRMTSCRSPRSARRCSRLAGTPVRGGTAVAAHGPTSRISPDGPAVGLHLPGVQRRAVGAPRGRARALPLPRRPRLLRGGDGRRPGQRGRGGAVDGARRCSRSAASCCGGSPSACTTSPAPSSASDRARATPRSAPRSSAASCTVMMGAVTMTDDRRRGLRGAAGVPQAQPRARLHGLQAREPQRRFRRRMDTRRLRSPSATTSTSSRSTPTSTSSSSRCC